jgi:hypothetical protein
MRYFNLTHRPGEWPVPAFMERVSTVPVGEGVTDLSERYPHLRDRGRELSEYATLFAVRRLLQESWGPDGTPQPPLGGGGAADLPGDARRARPHLPQNETMVGVCHYRRYAVTEPVGKPSFAYGLVTPEEFAELPDRLFLPPPKTVLMPAPINLGMPIVTQYGAEHVTRDLLHFMGIAIDLGIVDDRTVADFLGHNVMIAAPTTGVFPAEWLVLVLEALESVVDAFEATVAVPREGYQRRALGFCCERLHSLLTASLVARWPEDKLIATRAVVVSTEETYTDGG